MGDYNNMSEATKKKLYPNGEPDHVKDKPEQEPSIQEVCDAMKAFGIPFIAKLSELIELSPKEDLAKIIEGWPGEWKHWRNVAKDIKNGKL